MQGGGHVDLYDQVVDSGSNYQFISQDSLLNTLPIDLDLGIPEQIDLDEEYDFTTQNYNWNDLDPSFGLGDYVSDRNAWQDNSDYHVGGYLDPAYEPVVPNQEHYDNTISEIVGVAPIAPEPLDEGVINLLPPQSKQYRIDLYNNSVIKYNEDLETYQANLKSADNQYNKNFVQPFNEYVEAVNNDHERNIRLDMQGKNALSYIFRIASQESINKMLQKDDDGNFMNLTPFGTMDLSLLERAPLNNSPFKLPNGEILDRGNIQLEDLYQGTAEDFISMIDEEAEAAKQEAIATIDKRISSQLNLIKRLESDSRGAPGIPSAERDLKTLKKEKQELEATEGYGRDIAARKYFENYVFANMMLSEDEWRKSTLMSRGRVDDPNIDMEAAGFGTYKDYVARIEKKIYADLLYNKDGYEFAQAVGMPHFGLVLDEDVAVGERNARFADAALSWRQGVNQLEGMIHATGATYKQISNLGIPLVGAGSPLNQSPYLNILDFGIGAFNYYVMGGSEDLTDENQAIRDELFKRDQERNKRISELESQKTQFAVTGQQLDLLGSDAILNEGTRVEHISSIYNQARRDMVFSEQIDPAIQSMPTSLAVMSVALATSIPTGGSSLVAAGAGGLTMGTLVTNRTYYDSFSNPIFYEKNPDGSVNWGKSKISETERHGMSFMHGGAEGLGEGLGTLVTFGVGKFALTPAKFSPYSIFKGSPGAVGITKFSGGRKLLDYGFGLTYSVGLGAGEEFIAEGATGVSQMAIDSYFSGETYTTAQYAERFMKDGKIGAWAGGGMTGGSYNVGVAKANLYEKNFAPEVYSQKVFDTYTNQLTSSGFFFNGVDKSKLKQLNKALATIRKETASGGTFMNLTDVQKDAVKLATELTEELNTSQVRDELLLQNLYDSGRGDLVAEVVAIDNRLLYLQSVTSEYTQNENGQWLDSEGNPTEDPTNMELYKIGQALSETTKDQHRAEMKTLQDRMDLIKTMAEADFIQSPDYTPAARDIGVGNWRENEYYNTKDGSNSYSEVVYDQEKGEVQGDVNQEYSDIINRYSEAAAGQAKIVQHTTRESMLAVTGDASALAFYKEATVEERNNNKIDELHVYVGEGQTVKALNDQMVHEFGHFAFRDVVADKETRESLVSQILEIDNDNVKNTVNQVRAGYPDVSQEVLEVEIINHFMQDVATGKLSQTDITQGFESWGLNIMNTAGKLGVTSSDAILRNKDSVVKLAAKYSNFVNRNGGITGIRTPGQAQAAKTQRQAEAAMQESETSDGAGLAAKKFNYLENTKIYYTESVFREGRDAISRISSVRERTADLSDYNHFRNLYAKLTGNGVAPDRMKDIYFIKDGKRFDVRPPRPKTNKQGEVLQMEVPTRMTYNERRIARALETQEYEDMLAQERADLMTEVGDLWRNNDKSISSYTNFLDFNPTIRGEFDLGPRSRTIESINSDIEDFVIAKQNIQALIDSDITEDDLKALAGRGSVISRSKHPNIFNMMGLRKSETHTQKADRLTNSMEGKGAVWQLLPKDSPSYEKRIPDLRLATPAELQYASDRFDRIEDEPLDGDRLDIDASEPTGLAARSINYDKRKAIFKGVTAENFNDFINGKIKSGSIQSFEDLKNLMREANMLDSTGKLQMSLHNVDRTMVGPGSLPVHGDTFNFHLSGGPMGNSVAAVQGANVGHNTTTRQSSINITTYADKAKQNNNTYLLALKLLSEENSFGNPQVFKIAVQYSLQYLQNEKTPEATQDTLIESLNSFFNNKSYVSGLRYEQKDAEKVISLLGKKFQPFGMVDGVTMQTGSMQINSRQGLINFLQEISNASLNEITSNTSFADRASLAGRFFKTRVGLSAQPGFVSQEQFLDAVNQSEYKGVENGAVVNATLMDVNNTNLHGIKGVSGHLKGVGADALSESTSYDFGVTGHIATFHFEKPMSNESVDGMHARQQTTGAFLASRRLPGRIYTQGLSAWEQSTPTAYGATLQRLATKFQDRFSDVLLLQQDIEVFKGSKVPESQDFEMAMDIMYGKVRTDLEALEVVLADIQSSMKSANLTAEQVSDYLYAKHAEERNKKIEKTRPEMKDGSGMTTEEAGEIIQELETPEMVAISKIVYSVIENTRKTMVQSGLETQEIIEVWEGLYKNYVPLNGLSADEIDGDNSSYPTGGAGMAIYGKTTKVAKGRASKSGVNLIANVIMQNAMVQQRARKNQAMMSLYNLVKKNPNEEVWGIFSTKKPMRKTNKEGKRVNMNEFEMKSDRRMVPIRVNGEQHFIFFKKSDYADALNGMTEEKLSKVFKVMSGPMTFMRNAFTQYNPSFFVGNFFRDIHGAVFNVMSEIEREGGILQGYDINTKKFTSSLVKRSFSVLGHLLKDSAFSREMSPEMREYLTEWEASGGRTGFSYSESINNVIENLRVDAETPGKVKAATQYAFSKPKQFFQYVANVNEAFENSIRLAAYIEAREAGVTKQRAAQLSKNITINFNKSGELGPSLNQTFLFFNAAVQGATRFSRTFATLKAELPNNPDETTSWKNRVTSAQKVAAGMVLLSGLQTILNMSLSGRDDDGELYYNKIPEYKKERGFIICYGSGPNDYISIPLGYGYNMFNVFGMLLAEVSSGARHYDDALVDFSLSAYSAFSPIAMGNTDEVGPALLKSVTPTVLKSPLDAFAWNETYFGGKVFQEQFPFGAETPVSTMSFRSPDVVQDLFVGLHEMTGGKTYIDGSIEINPDPYYYIASSYWGGAGDFVMDVTTLGRSAYVTGARKYNALISTRTNEEFIETLFKTPQEDRPVIRFNDVPIVKTIYGAGASRFYDFDLYEKNVYDVLQFDKELRKGTVESRQGVDFTGIQALKKEYLKVEDALRVIREEKKKARDIEDYIDRSNRAYQLQEAERQLVTIFNAKYYQLRGQYLDPKPQGFIPINDIRQILGTDE